MIKNQHQYEITKSKLEQFENVRLNILSDKLFSEDELRYNLYLTNIQSTIQELEDEIKEYKKLLNNNTKDLKIEDLSKLPDLITKLMIAKKITYQHLADDLDMYVEKVENWFDKDFETIPFYFLLELIDYFNITVEVKVND